MFDCLMIVWMFRFKTGRVMQVRCTFIRKMNIFFFIKLFINLQDLYADPVHPDKYQAKIISQGTLNQKHLHKLTINSKL